MDRLGRAIACAAGCAALALLVTAPRPVGSETTYAWPILQKIRRIAVVSPFFYARPYAPSNEERDEFIRQAPALAAVVARTTQRDLAEDNRFVLVPPEAVRRALRELHWTDRDLFTGFPGPSARARRSGIGAMQHNIAPGKEPWPAPNLARIARLASKLGVDGVVVGTMREPISVGAGIVVRHDDYSLNPINVGMRRVRDHVDSPRIHAALVSRSGEIAWSDDLLAEHPRTKRRTSKTLAIDWQEATQEVVQLMADSLLRLPPPEQQKRP
jgi:hypothetical protein